MTVPRELEAKILRCHHVEKWPVGTIARQLGVHHDTVERVLAQSGLPAIKQVRSSMIDEYRPFIEATLKEYPDLTASRLHDMVCERGYRGGPDHFRHVLARIRPRKPAEAYLRLRTLPGEQAQVDWGHFGKLVVGRARRRLMAFVMVLSFSRKIFLKFFLGSQMGRFLRAHVQAYEYFGAVARVHLYDNLKSAVLERIGDAIRFHPTFLDLAKHYRFEPRPVAKGRGNEKGRVERGILYVRSSFWPARTFDDLDDLNAQAREWCDTKSAQRPCPEDRSMTVQQAYELEKPSLLALPDNPFPAHDRVEVSVGKTPYVRFDLNDYSVPHTLVRRELVVVADEATVRILDGNKVVATHPRSWDKGEQIEIPEHIEALVRYKRHARTHRGLDRLTRAVPAASDLMVLLAQRGENLGSCTAALLRLLDRHGREAMAEAVAEAIEKGSPHPNSVRHVIERNAKAKEVAPAVPVALPDDPRVRDLVVNPHQLTNYDQIKPEDDDEND
jgi:transposase